MNSGIDILLVEDDPYDVELTLRAFKENRLTNSIHVVRDGAEAIDYLFPADVSATPSKPKCVLLDLKLPKIDGLEVLRRIKTDPRTNTLPVIVLTSSKEASDVKAAYEYGVNSYLCKPVEFNEFVDVVKQLGLYWLLLNEPPDEA